MEKSLKFKALWQYNGRSVYQHSMKYWAFCQYGHFYWLLFFQHLSGHSAKYYWILEPEHNRNVLRYKSWNLFNTKILQNKHHEESRGLFFEVKCISSVKHEKKVKLKMYVKTYCFGSINLTRVFTIMENKVLVKANLSSCQICIVIPFEIILTFNSISI